MRRVALLSLVAVLAAARNGEAQIVPLSRCQAAIPCSIPFGLRPAGSVALSPYARTGQGNTGISVSAGIEEGLKPKIDKPPVSEDPTDRAVRLYLKKNPPPTQTPTPKRVQS